MSEFEENLWLEVLRDHGWELARAGRPVRKRRRATRPQLVAGTTLGLAASATAAALLLGASTSPPAFAVTRNPDGTVSVSLRQRAGIAGANETLAAMGVRAHIAGQAKVAPKLYCPGGTAPTITFDPGSIPRSRVLMIAPGQPSSSVTAAPKAYGGGGTASGDPGAGARSGGSNQVVRTYPRRGQIRTDSGPGNHVVRMYCP